MIDTPKHQFQIPDYPGREEEPEFTPQDTAPMELAPEEVDRRFNEIVEREFPVEPEYDPRYLQAKQIESDIIRMRISADNTTIPRYGINRLLYSTFQSLEAPLTEEGAKSLEKQLVDIEADIGGDIRPLPKGIKSQKFFFYDKTSINDPGDPTRDTNFWYYQSVDARGTAEASYQVPHDYRDGIVKIVNGLTEPCQPGEAEELLKMIADYYQAVKDQLYFKA